MKKRLLLFCASFLAMSFAQVKADTAFDLTTFEGTVPAGCEIDTIDNVPYLKVRVDGWSTYFNVNPIELTEGSSIEFSYKYDKDTCTYTSEVKAFIQLISVSSWDNKFAFIDAPASETFKTIKGASKVDSYDKFQLAVQQTSSPWSTVKGACIYISKLKVKIPFDIRTFNGTVPDGAELVTIDGKKYLKVIVNAWDSKLMVKSFNVKKGYKASCDIKIVLGSASADTLTLAKVKGGINLMDTVNKVKNPWGPGQVASSATLAQSPATGSFSTITSALHDSSKIINQIQFFGQLNVSPWSPTIGDTIWISPVSIVSTSPIILDPADVDASILPAGVTIVTIDDTKYFQAVLNGWSSEIYTVPTVLPAGSSASCKMKYSLGSATADTLAITDIKSIIMLKDTFNLVQNPWGDDMVPAFKDISLDPATSNFTKASAALATEMKYINYVQFYGQEKLKWGPTTGDTIWVGIISLDQVKPSAVGDLTAVYDGEKVTLSWTASTDNDVLAGYVIYQGDKAIGKVTSLTFDVTDLTGGTTFSVKAIDRSENESAASTVTAITDKVSTISKTSVKVYPNPVASELKVSSDENINTISVYGISGQLAKIMNVNANNASISVSDLTSGTYFVRVQTANGVNTQRIVKK